MSHALKTQIETTILQAILSFASATGSQLDPDLEPQQRVKDGRRGFLLLEQDYKRGPLVAVKVMGFLKQQDEMGGGAQGRGMIKKALVRVQGMSAYSRDPQETIADCANLEEIVQLNLLKYPLSQVKTDYTSGGKLSYASNLNWLSNSFEEDVIAGEQSAPAIAQPVPSVSNASTGTVAINNASAYSADGPNTYTVQIVSANTTPGSLAGMMWQWKKGTAGSYSALQNATGAFQALADGVQIKFALASGQNFVANDQWTIQASADGLNYVAMFTQDYEVQVGSLTGIYTNL